MTQKMGVIPRKLIKINELSINERNYKNEKIQNHYGNLGSRGGGSDRYRLQ